MSALAEARLKAAEGQLEPLFPAQDVLRREVARTVLRAADEAEGREPARQESPTTAWGLLAGGALGVGLEAGLNQIHSIHTISSVLIVLGAIILGAICGRAARKG